MVSSRKTDRQRKAKTDGWTGRTEEPTDKRKDRQSERPSDRRTEGQNTAGQSESHTVE